MRNPIAKLVDLGKLHLCVQQRDRKRDASEKCFPSQPQERRAVLSHRPQRAQRLDAFVGLSQDVDRLSLQRVEAPVRSRRHLFCMTSRLM